MLFKPHYPPHLYLDEHIYFVTARTVDAKPYFNDDNKKQLLQDIINSSCRRSNADLIAWVILSNHYHILFNLPKGDQLPKLMQYINGSSAFQLNRMENIKGRKVWFNYFDTCIRGEKDLYTRINYIHHNPRKHGYIKEVDNLMEYPFSSYKDYVEKYGEDWIRDSFEKFPILDVSYAEGITP